MKPERVQTDDTSPAVKAPRQLLSHRLEFDTFGDAARFLGQLGDLADSTQDIEVEWRNGVVTVRVASDGGLLTSRETAFMERVRGIA